MVLWKIGVLIGTLAGTKLSLASLFVHWPDRCHTTTTSYASEVQLRAKRSPVDFLPDGDPR